MPVKTTTPKRDAQSEFDPRRLSFMGHDASKSPSSPARGSRVSKTPLAIRFQNGILKKWSITSLDDILPSELRPPSWTEHILTCLATLSKHETLLSAREMLEDQIKRRKMEDRAQGKTVMTVRSYLTKRDVDEVVRRYKNQNRSSSSRETSVDTRNRTPGVDAENETGGDTRGGTEDANASHGTDDDMVIEEIVVSLGSEAGDSPDETTPEKAVKPTKPEKPAKRGHVAGQEKSKPAPDRGVASSASPAINMPSPSVVRDPVVSAHRATASTPTPASQNKRKGALQPASTPRTGINPAPTNGQAAGLQDSPSKSATSEPQGQPVPSPSRAKESRRSEGPGKAGVAPKIAATPVSQKAAELAVSSPRRSAVPPSSTSNTRSSANAQAAAPPASPSAKRAPAARAAPPSQSQSPVPLQDSNKATDSNQKQKGSGTPVTTASVASTPLRLAQPRVNATNITSNSSVVKQVTQPSRVSQPVATPLPTAAAPSLSKSTPASPSPLAENAAQTTTSSSDTASMKLAASVLKHTNSIQEPGPNVTSTPPGLRLPTLQSPRSAGPPGAVAAAQMRAQIKQTPLAGSVQTPAAVPTNSSPRPTPVSAVPARAADTAQHLPMSVQRLVNGSASSQTPSQSTPGTTPAAAAHASTTHTSTTHTSTTHPSTAHTSTTQIQASMPSPVRTQSGPPVTVPTASDNQQSPHRKAAAVGTTSSPSSLPRGAGPVLADGGLAFSVPRQPASQKPVSQPKVSQHSATQPTAAQNPAIEQPATVSQMSTLQNAAFEMAASDKPVLQTVASQHPAPQPTSQQPLSRQPTLYQPVSQPSVAQTPITEQAVTRQPTVQQPVLQQPHVQQPVSQQVAPPQPATQTPAAHSFLSASQRSSLQQLGDSHPAASQPGARRVESLTPDASPATISASLATPTRNSLKRKQPTSLVMQISAAEREKIIAEAQLNYARMSIEHERSTIAEHRATLDLLARREATDARQIYAADYLQRFADECDDVLNPKPDDEAMEVGGNGAVGTDVQAWWNWAAYAVTHIISMLKVDDPAAKRAEAREELNDAEDRLRAAQEDERTWATKLAEQTREIAALRAEQEAEGAQKRQRVS